MVELRRAAFVAAPAGAGEETAAAEVPDPDDALHPRRHVVRVRREATAAARTVGGAELLARQIREQRVEDSLEDLGLVPARDRVAEQVLGEPQLLLHGGVGRESNPILSG